MTDLYDRRDRYGPVSRWLHWGMAVLLAAQFLAAWAHWALPREHPFREAVWAYHPDLGITLFVLVLLRGGWGLANLSRRPLHRTPLLRAAMVVHGALYALMIVVPAMRIFAATGSKRGLDWLGIQLVAPRAAKVEWMDAASEWHGELGWVLGALIVGHAAMGLVWHGLVRRDGVLQRMMGR